MNGMADAFAAGVEPGGLSTAEEIKILLCYMLTTVNCPMRRDEVTDILTGGGMANYFDIEEAIEELVRLQHLVQTEDRLIAATVTGAQIGENLSVRIPYTLRERSVKAALQLLRRRELEKDNRVTTQKCPDGGYEVICTVMDKGRSLLSVSLHVGDEWQAAQIREQFLKDPALLYQGTLAVLTGSAALRRSGKQIVIDI